MSNKPLVTDFEKIILLGSVILFGYGIYKKIIKKNKTTCILVTHNIEDALSMSDRIIRLKNGKIEEEK